MTPTNSTGTCCDLSVAVLAADNEQTIGPAIRSVRTAIQNCGLTGEVVVIDDASTDETPSLLHHLLETPSEVGTSYWRVPEPVGFGSLYVEAAFRSRGRYFCALPGNHGLSPGSLSRLFSRAGTASVIVTRPAPSTFLKRAWNRELFRRIVRTVAGSEAADPGSPAVLRRGDILRWHGGQTGGAIQVDLVTRLIEQGATWSEVTIDGVVPSPARTVPFSERMVSSAITLLSILARRVGHRLFPDDWRGLGTESLALDRNKSDQESREPVLDSTSACQPTEALLAETTL